MDVNVNSAFPNQLEVGDLCGKGFWRLDHSGTYTHMQCVYACIFKAKTFTRPWMIACMIQTCSYGLMIKDE